MIRDYNAGRKALSNPPVSTPRREEGGSVVPIGTGVLRECALARGPAWEDSFQAERFSVSGFDAPGTWNRSAGRTGLNSTFRISAMAVFPFRPG